MGAAVIETPSAFLLHTLLHTGRRFCRPAVCLDAQRGVSMSAKKRPSSVSMAAKGCEHGGQ